MCMVITGASSGIGRALALALTHHSHRLVVTGRSEHKLKALVEDIHALDPALQVAPIATDLADSEQTEHLAQLIRNEAPDGIRALIHCAGIGDLAPNLQEWSFRDLEAALRINVLAPMQLTHALLDRLTGQPDASARVILLGAGIDRRVQSGTGSYGISKMALRRLFEQWQMEFSQRPGAPLMSLFQPGLVDTPGIQSHTQTALKHALPHAQWLADQLAAGNALTAEQAASALAYTVLDVPDLDFNGTVFHGRELVDSLFFSGS